MKIAQIQENMFNEELKELNILNNIKYSCK